LEVRRWNLDKIFEYWKEQVSKTKIDTNYDFSENSQWLAKVTTCENLVKELESSELEKTREILYDLLYHNLFAKGAFLTQTLIKSGPEVDVNKLKSIILEMKKKNFEDKWIDDLCTMLEKNYPEKWKKIEPNNPWQWIFNHLGELYGKLNVSTHPTYNSCPRDTIRNMGFDTGESYKDFEEAFKIFKEAYSSEVGKLSPENIPINLEIDQFFNFFHKDEKAKEFLKKVRTRSLAAVKANVPRKCFIITQYPGSKYNDIEGVQYQYDSHKANRKDFEKGVKVIVQSKRDNNVVFIGRAKIDSIEESPATDEKGKSITEYVAKFTDYVKIDPPEPRTTEILEEMKSLPQYGSQPPAILPIPRSLFKKITGEEIEDEFEEEGSGLMAEEDCGKYGTILERKKQLIFYGPPGTGKTMNAIELAECWIKKNKAQKTEDPTQFEEFSDEQFNEHIITNIKENAKSRGFELIKESDSENLYTLKNSNKIIKLGFIFSKNGKQRPDDVYLGVPTKMVGFLGQVPIKDRFLVIINSDVKNYLILPYAIEQQYARFVSGEVSGKWDRTGKGQHAFHVTITKEKSELPNLNFPDSKYDCTRFLRNINRIFQDCTYITKITFHPSYSYEEFIEGIRAEVKEKQIGFSIQDGIFKEVCKCAEDDLDNNYVLIIDEINRGNIPQIFGELITLIEKDKRGKRHSVSLTYSKEPFSVPENLYIIGTMNTADKSLAMLDIALRRRFAFVELMPNSKYIQETVPEISLRKLLDGINSKIYKELRDKQIGHSYFMNDISSVKDLQLIGGYKRKYFWYFDEILAEHNLHNRYSIIRKKLEDNLSID